MKGNFRWVLARKRKQAFLRESPFDIIEDWRIPALCSRRNDAWGDPDSVMKLSVVTHYYETLQIHGWSRIPMRYRLEKKMEDLIKGGVPNPTPEPLTVFQDSRGFQSRAKGVERDLFKEDWCRHRNGEWRITRGKVKFSYWCDIDRFDSNPMIFFGILDDIGLYRITLGRFFEIDVEEYLWFRNLDDFSSRYEKVVNLFCILVDELVPFTH